MSDFIRFALENFTLTFLVLGLVASLVSLLLSRKAQPPAAVVEALFFYFLMFSIGFSFLYNFVVHVFFGEVAARFIGWSDSPFQAEVGFASLGFAVVGFLACWRFRSSARGRGRPGAVSSRRGLWARSSDRDDGQPLGRQRGVVLYTDVLIPVMGFVLLWLQQRHGEGARRDIT
jgi:hypothetical protein